MADYDIVYKSYYGALLVTQLLSSRQTILPGIFDEAVSATLSDHSGTLDVGEQTLINGVHYTMQGSGTAQPGISQSGLVVPTGIVVDLLIFSHDQTGEVIFVYPNGVPNLLGAIALVVDLEPVGYRLSAEGPVGFVAGTSILCPTGERNVQSLAIGDRVLDIFGQEHAIICTGSTEIDLDQMAFDGAAPVRFEVGALGPGQPLRPLKLSPQHRVPLPEQGAQDGLCIGPALGFVGMPGIRRAHPKGAVRYFHFLLDRHALILANGTIVESFYPGQQALLSLDPVGRADVSAALTAAGYGDKAYPSAAQFLNMRHTRRALGLWPEEAPEPEIRLAG
ncbi:Hint domain-containing protein [Roseovarius sp.]|uniref:Hint domain-containing protein n=1 Tax=Roseovarius sp. TaxID=1486281 RepID=UPI003A968D3C